MFLIANLRRSRAASSASASISCLIATSPAASSGSASANAASASTAAVSITVPDGSMKVIDSSVRYAFSLVPQHMPLALLAITPPTVHAAALAGSGPSR